MFDFLKVTSRGYTSVVSTARGWPWLLFSVAFLCCVFFLYVTFNHFATRMQALANNNYYYYYYYCYYYYYYYYCYYY